MFISPNKKMKYFIQLLLLLLLIISCNKSKDRITPLLKEEDNLMFFLGEQIKNFIDSSECEKEKVVEVRYQKYKNKEYIQISAQEVFITDSLYILKEYKNYLIAFYNEDFFSEFIQKDTVKNNSIINKNPQWDFNKNGSNKTGYPCFDMYEKKGSELIKVKSDTYEYNNLFTNPPMHPMPEPPLLKETV